MLSSAGFTSPLLSFSALAIAVGSGGPLLKRVAKRNAARVLLSVVTAAAAFTPLASVARETASPTPGASPQAAPEPESAPAAPSTEGGFDMSKLTPEQQQALRLAIIKLSQNPVGNITVLPFQNNFNYGIGPYTRYGYNLNVQPVVPIMLSPTWSLVARTILPIVNLPSFAPPTACASAAGCGSTFGIGDTQEQLFFGPKTKPGQLIWAVGPLLAFPTGSPQNVLGTGKWGAGLNVAALVMPGKWVIGALVTQYWSYAGHPNYPNYSNFLVQPFINYNLKDGWALSTAPSITANWDAPGSAWAVPIGGGISKTFKAGDQLMSLAVSYYTYVTRPITTQQTQLRVQWSLLWPVKRGINVQDLLQQAK